MEEQQNKRPSWARRKFLINEHFQLHFIAFAAILSLAASVFFYVASSYFFMKYHEYAVEVGMRPSDPFFRVLFNMEMMLTNIFVGTSVAVVVISVIGGLLFSHRVAGPMYRLRSHCESVARGETLDNVVFRKKDYFIDVAIAYNASMHLIRQKLGVEPQTADTAHHDAPVSVGSTEEAQKMGYEQPVDVASPENVAEIKKAS